MNDLGKKVVLELKNITKSFGETEVLKGISLAIHEGEFVTLLGSSGCGKTTTLRIIAGLEYPDSGEVQLEGKAMGDTAPEKRNVNTVFQNYALFPHMNVYDNIAYGLKLRKLPKAQIQEQVKRMLSLVQLDGFEKRMPSEMSGGQRQRVAIARALVNNPRVLLLDEPLGALDLQLRRQMQIELKKLQKKLGITFIYITHDQEEAINMSDVIVVMKDGYFEQAGSPAEIYDHPKTSYVASFVGSANVLQGNVKEVVVCCEDTDHGSEILDNDGSKAAKQDETYAVIETKYGTMCCKTENYHVTSGQNVTIAVRSENISVWAQPKAEYYLTGVITETSFVGGMLRIVVRLGGEENAPEVVISRHGINFHYDIGQKVYLEWNPQQAVLVDMEA